MSCDIGYRCGLDTVLLRPWSRMAVTAPIGPLAWEPPHAMGTALKKKKKKKKGNKKKKKRFSKCEKIPNRAGG